ncbi:hypothetical protein IGX29_01015 [Streptomyces sp. H28]|uniref:hypothetical protein n=1 Tax=Streptomyces sp. H28 TaxID=2775865 RepID=UPI001786F5B6|nr:hypothetical protein [Streptomyces sp. H28]MBD9730415.1 hypothetical protein [Streptomyces sp. H28]
MLTLHAADLVVLGGGRPAVPDGAVLVDGRTLAAAGPYAVLAAAHPAARTRRWPGLLTPGLVHPRGPEVLEHTYHPDPREAGEMGTAPLTGEALAGLGMTEARWGASARRGVQRLLAHGVVAVAGPLRRPAVVDAVQRAGLGVRPPAEDPGDAAGPDPLAGRSLARVTAPPPAVGEGPATFAVFDVPDEAALTARGAATCVATVLAGRLVHRRR